MSSLKERPMRQRIGVVGEVGLTGEIRAVPNVSKRLIELEKLGFDGCVLPEKNRLLLRNYLFKKFGEITDEIFGMDGTVNVHFLSTATEPRLI